jgi:aldehyde:ferredoxin oxidoreductase
LNQIGLNKPQHRLVLNEEKVEYALKTQYNYSALDSMGLCQFVYGPSWQLYGPQDTAEILAAATGWKIAPGDIQAYGKRRLDLMRALNAREGLSRADDTLPEKVFRKALKGGKSDGVRLDQEELEAGLDMYFEQAGWHIESGNPTRETLEQDNLQWVADELGL